MPKITDEKLARICVRLYDKDYQEIKKFATADRPANALIRDIIHQYVLHAGAALRAKIDALESETGGSIDLDVD